MPGRSLLPLVALLALLPPSALGKGGAECGPAVAECGPAVGLAEARAGAGEASSRSRLGRQPALLAAGDEHCEARIPAPDPATLANPSQRTQPESSRSSFVVDVAAEHRPDRPVAACAGSRAPPGEPLFIQHRALLI